MIYYDIIGYIISYHIILYYIILYYYMYRTPRPQTKTISKLVSLISFSKPYMFLNSLSGVLLGIGGSDFIG